MESTYDNCFIADINPNTDMQLLGRTHPAEMSGFTILLIMVLTSCWMFATNFHG